MEPIVPAYEENCPICMELLFLPELFPKCQHVFCKLCLKILDQQQMVLKCPLCRTEGKLEEILPLPRLDAKIKKDHPQQYEKRKQQYDIEITKVPITFSYGNKTQVLNRKGNNYRWTFFFSAKDKLTSTYVQKVEIKLHPTFKPSVITLREEDKFQFVATGWGTFQIGIKVFWKPIMGGSFTQLSHHLEFQPLVENKITKRKA